MRSSTFLLVLCAAALAGACQDDLVVLVETAGISPDDVVAEVEDLGKPDAARLAELANRGDIDGTALLDEQACSGPCRAALVTLFVKNTGTERAAPPVVRFSAPAGKPARVPVAYRGEEISSERIGRIRFLVALWPGEKKLTVRVSGSVFIEVNTVPPKAPADGGAAAITPG